MFKFLTHLSDSCFSLMVLFQSNSYEHQNVLKFILYAPAWHIWISVGPQGRWTSQHHRLQQHWPRPLGHSSTRPLSHSNHVSVWTKVGQIWQKTLTGSQEGLRAAHSWSLAAGTSLSRRRRLRASWGWATSMHRIHGWRSKGNGRALREWDLQEGGGRLLREEHWGHRFDILKWSHRCREKGEWRGRTEKQWSEGVVDRGRHSRDCREGGRALWKQWIRRSTNSLFTPTFLWNPPFLAFPLCFPSSSFCRSSPQTLSSPITSSFAEFSHKHPNQWTFLVLSPRSEWIWANQRTIRNRAPHPSTMIEGRWITRNPFGCKYVWFSLKISHLSSFRINIHEIFKFISIKTIRCWQLVSLRNILISHAWISFDLFWISIRFRICLALISNWRLSTLMILKIKILPD
jgi:hypothetical protein